MKQILITLVAVVLGITAMSSYADKQREGTKTVNVLIEGSKAGNGEDAKKRFTGEYPYDPFWS